MSLIRTEGLQSSLEWTIQGGHAMCRGAGYEKKILTLYLPMGAQAL